MRMQLSQQAEELLGQRELVIITERVDDVALLIGQMITMGLPDVLDRHIPRHWKQRGLSWGWTAVIWLAHILTEGDHRKVAVEVYIKGMMGSLDPLGMPLATDVLSGERADDGLYLALMERLRPSVKTPGLLFVGDCKMSALETRASIAGHHDLYLSPLPLTGATAEAMEAWISAGVARGETGELVRLFRTNDRGHEVLAAEGYEFARTCCAKGSHEGWTERVVIVRSPVHANQQAVGLDKRLRHAETALAALTPPRGRGKRQITDEATLVEAIALVLTAHRVEGLLSVAWDKQVERHTRYLGRGRGSASRQQRVIEQTRYHITRIARQEDI